MVTYLIKWRYIPKTVVLKFHTISLPDLLFHPEDGGSIFLLYRITCRYIALIYS
jgi:hypothetical protein